MEPLINGFLGMSNRDLWISFAGVGIPFVTAAINNAAASPLVKWLTYAVVSVIAAAGFVWAYGAFNTDDIPRLVLLLGVVAIATYHLFHKSVAHFEVLTDKALGREPASTLAPPAVEINQGAAVNVQPVQDVRVV